MNKYSRKHKKLDVMQSRIKNESHPKPSTISPHKVVQLGLINTVYHLLVKNKKGEGRGDLKERRRLITFFP